MSDGVRHFILRGSGFTLAPQDEGLVASAVGATKSASIKRCTLSASRPLTVGSRPASIASRKSAIGLIPCLGGLFLFLLGMVGIGGSVITWFGVRLPQAPAVTVYIPPTDSGQVPPAA